MVSKVYRFQKHDFLLAVHGVTQLSHWQKKQNGV